MFSSSDHVVGTESSLAADQFRPRNCGQSSAIEFSRLPTPAKNKKPKFQKLKNLDVGATELTDDSFRQLAALPNLQVLNVANTGIGFDVIDELAETHKDLKVIEYED